jgi:hypothetical protein
MAFPLEQPSILHTYAFDLHCYNVGLICKQRPNMHLPLNLVTCLGETPSCATLKKAAISCKGDR